MKSKRTATKKASDLVDELYASVIEGLDTEKGGIGWITDQIGWKHSALIGEYLLSAIQGVKSSLLSSELTMEEYKTLERSQNFNIAREARESIEKLGSVDSMASLPSLGSHKETLLDVYRDHTLVTLAQALDRLAAVVVTAAGVKTNIIRVDWNNLVSIAERAQKDTPYPHRFRVGEFCDVGSPGRERQNHVLKTAVQWKDHGPEDWLTWLSKARNTAVHRAPRLNFTMHIRAGKHTAGGGTIRPFWLQPDWAETEIMFRNVRKKIDEVILMQSPYKVLEGLLNSVALLCAAALKEMVNLWNERKADPSLIVQPAGQWPNLGETKQLGFTGYGKLETPLGDTAFVSPDRVKRWSAARLNDYEISHWRND